MGCVHRFAVERNQAYSRKLENEAGCHFLRNDNFVHHAHDPTYSYFSKRMKTGAAWRVCFGWTTSKGSKLVTVHTIMERGPLVTDDE